MGVMLVCVVGVLDVVFSVLSYLIGLVQCFVLFVVCLSWAKVRRVSLGREFRWGNLRGKLLHGFVMVVLYEVCLYYAGVYLC